MKGIGNKLVVGASPMHLNTWLALGPSGMILVGLLSILIWRVKSHAGMKYFLAGGAVWAAAISLKLILEITLTPKLLWISSLGSALFLTVMGIYVGIRTGLFECGLTYIAFLKSELKNMSFDEAIAFGIGFGASEAILLGIQSLIQILMFTLNPALLYMIPEPQRRIAEASLSMPTWVIAAPIIERTFTLFSHIFAALLILVSVVRSKSSFFLLSFTYKSLLDALVPYIQATFKPNISPVGAYEAEVWVVVMGSIALFGIAWMKRRFYLPVDGLNHKAG